MIYCDDSINLVSYAQNNSVHAVITDPPYGLHLMGHDWDKVLPNRDIWRRCFDVLRPGGFCLAFGHTRLFHRLGLDLEDAGFVIKDCLCWGFASGFPHSYDISKAIDKKKGAERKVVGKRVHPTLRNKPKVKSNAYHAETLTSDEQMESWEITAPATPEAAQWQGWGTQMKTSWEPIILAQKPIEGTYIENIFKYQVGALNIDACRIPYASEEDRKSLCGFINFAGADHGDDKYFSANTGGSKQVNVHPDGRCPANLLWLDPLFADYDRMFMIPKPSTSEKGDYNHHPTVKPLQLMEHLVKLITPRPSIVKSDVFVLDPFMGSGSTGVACKRLDRRFIGIEKDRSNFKIAERRLKGKVTHFDMFER